MKTVIPTTALLAATAVFGFSVAHAQTTPSAGAPAARASSPAPFRNLKVFPKDIARPELIANMRSFSQSLGVHCTFCHVGTEGQPATNDFASDAKKEKLIARKMLAMVHRINQEDLGVTDMSKAKVTCFTCHRGSPHPLTVPPASPPPGSSTTTTPPPKAPERG